jgi:hypothetical protein
MLRYHDNDPGLAQLLADRDHSLTSVTARAGTDVWPPPGIIVTVAAELDETLFPAYRKRYYVCRPDAEELPLLRADSRFALPQEFANAAKRGRPQGQFLLGPVRWLLVRIRRLPQLLLWPESTCLQDLDEFPLEYLRAVPDLAARVRDVHRGQATVPVLALDTREEHDCSLLWSAAAAVDRACYNFYVADVCCQEVYLLHHHDKIVVSIPDPEARSALVEELKAYSEVLQDYSDYDSSMDFSAGGEEGGPRDTGLGG